MAAQKGRTDIGDQINKKIIAPLAAANRLGDFPDFDDSGIAWLGQAKAGHADQFDCRFRGPALNFGAHRAEGDDILGGTYEYLTLLDDALIVVGVKAMEPRGH
jgi:type I restriction enzyme M protein